MQASMSSAYLPRLDGHYRHAPFALVHVHTGHLGGLTSSPWWHRHATPGAIYAEVLGLFVQRLCDEDRSSNDIEEYTYCQVDTYLAGHHRLTPVAQAHVHTGHQRGFVAA